MIRLIKSFKYDNNYDYVKMFSSKEEQENYFNSLEYIDIDDTNYIKVGNAFNINYNYDYLDNNGINYIIFDNGYRDIFAFIIEKEYINEKVTRIIYEIDVIQTFMFNFTINKSFIERKNCSINEIVDFDEGLNLGEHIIESENIVFTKDSVYFAMFNGFKEQQLIFENNVLKSVVDLPFNTSKPLTIIDDINYPLYFMPLLEPSLYKEVTYSDIGVGGSLTGYIISKKIFRFIKGYEGFGEYPYMANDEDFFTYGYGITEKYQKDYYDILGVPPCTEEKASRVFAELIFNNFATPLYNQMKSDGVNMLTINRQHFDAFLSLAYNGGLGAVTESTMYQKFLKNPNDTTITKDWLDYRTNGGLEGLVARRQAESNIYAVGEYEYRTIVTIGDGGVITGSISDNNGNGFIPENLQGDL